MTPDPSAAASRRAAEEIAKWWRDDSGPWLGAPDYGQLVDRIDTAIARAVAEERARWIDYVDWLNQASGGAATMAWIHGHRDSQELIEEGKRRRAALGYEPRAAAPANRESK